MIWTALLCLYHRGAHCFQGANSDTAPVDVIRKFGQFPFHSRKPRLLLMMWLAPYQMGFPPIKRCTLIWIPHIVTLGTVVAGSAAFAFGAADMMEAYQDLHYGMWESSKASFNPLHPYLDTPNFALK